MGHTPPALSHLHDKMKATASENSVLLPTDIRMRGHAGPKIKAYIQRREMGSQLGSEQLKEELLEKKLKEKSLIIHNLHNPTLQRSQNGTSDLYLWS